MGAGAGWLRVMLNLKSELVHATLVWRETGQQVVLEPPSEAAASSATGQNKGYHLFLSHKWEHAQDSTLRLSLCHCHCPREN